MARTAPVVVVLVGHEKKVVDGALSYTVRADGVLEVAMPDGSVVTFEDSDWIDVRMLAGKDDADT